MRGGSDQTKFGLAWINSKKLTQCVAAAAGPKRREALATGARHRKLGAGFYTFLIFKKESKTLNLNVLLFVFINLNQLIDCLRYSFFFVHD
jgi:hypothetical protein